MMRNPATATKIAAHPIRLRRRIRRCYVIEPRKRRRTSAALAAPDRYVAADGADADAVLRIAVAAGGGPHFARAAKKAPAGRPADLQRRIAGDSMRVAVVILFQLDGEVAVEVARERHLDAAAEGMNVQIVPGAGAHHVDADVPAHGADVSGALELPDIDVAAHGLGHDAAGAARHADVAAH